MVVPRNHRLAAVLALAGLLVLTGCGGGGEARESVGMPPMAPLDLDLSDTNFQAAGQASVSNALALTGAGVATPPGLLRQVVELTRRALRAPGSPLALLLGVELRQTLPCSEGGSAVLSVADTNGNGRFDIGDKLSLEAQSCKEDGTVLHGGISFAVQALNGVYDSSSYGATLAVSLSAFSATRGDDTVRGDGTLVLGVSQTPAGVGELSLSADFMMFTGRLAGKPFTTTLSAVRLTLRTDTFNGNGRTSISYEGQIYGDSLGRRVIVTTPEPLVIAASERYPGSGRLMVRGNAGSAMRITAVSATQALLELDAQGDGRYEAQVLKPWAALN